MAARSRQPDEARWFTDPGQVNQRRYEALRAYFVDGLTYAQAGKRHGYTRWAMINLVREHRAGKLELFAPPRRPGPPPGTAPAKERARARVIGLRRQGLSTYEISARLSAAGTPLNRTSVGEILAEEGFGRLVRRPEPEASISPATAGRDTSLPAASVIDFGAWPAAWPAPPAIPAAGSSPPSATCSACSRSSSPAPGASPTSMTCWPTRPRRYSRGWRCCRRKRRSPTTPTGCPTTTSSGSWPPSTPR